MISRALLLALSHLFLLVLTQWENALFALIPTLSPEQHLPLLLSLPALEPIGISALLWGGARILERYGLILVAWGAVALLNLLVVADQAVYAVLFDHLRPGLWQSGMPPELLLDSLRAELTPLFWGNLLLWGGVTWFTLRPPAWQRPSWLFPTRRSLVILGSLYLVAALWAWQRAPQGLERHPLTATLLDLTAPWLPSPSVADYDPLRDSRPSEPWLEEPAQAQALQQAVQSLAGAGERPNVVLILLESSGAEQVLTDHGGPDPKITPTLHRLAQSGILFPRIYPTQQASVGSIVELHSGGFLPTWENISRLLEHPYREITLPRALKGVGYQTALLASPDLSIRNVRAFVQQAGYDLHADFGRPGHLLQGVPRLNSWGGEDRAVMARAARWLEQEARPPFLLTLLANAPHHPFTLAEGETPLFPGTENRKERYLNALHAVDAAIGEIYAQLERSGQLEKTLWLVTADHGEALGDLHPRIRSHINHLYEESGRVFLLVSAPGRIKTPVISQRLGTLGDLLPTLLSLLKVPLPPDLSGQDLFSPAYHPTMIHLFMGKQPEILGLRDGNWKFIVSGDGSVELFDLEQDPQERQNVASRHAGRVARYSLLVRSWYKAKNQAFVQRLGSLPPVGDPPLDPLGVAGPVSMAMGRLGPERDEDLLRFHASPLLHPMEKQGVVWTRWVNDNREKTFTYFWSSPQGETRMTPYSLPKNLGETRLPIPFPAPLLQGTWRVELRDGEKSLMHTTFQVGEEIPHPGTEVPSELQEFAAGHHDPDHPNDKKIDPRRLIQPGSVLMLYSRWLVRSEPREFTTLLISPEGVGYRFPFRVVAGWNKHYQRLQPPASELIPGRWEILLLQGEGDDALVLLETTFTVSAAEASPSPP